MKNYCIVTNNVQWVLRSFLLVRCGLEYSEFTFKDDKIYDLNDKILLEWTFSLQRATNFVRWALPLPGLLRRKTTMRIAQAWCSP